MPGRTGRDSKIRGTRSGAVEARRMQDAAVPAGQFGAVTPPSQEALREAIAAQRCPWCGRGPYRILAGHTSRAHGVDRHELRRLAGLGRSDAICSPEVTSRVRERKETGDLDPPSKRPLPPGECSVCGKLSPVVGGHARATCGREECQSEAHRRTMLATAPWRHKSEPSRDEHGRYDG